MKVNKNNIGGGGGVRKKRAVLLTGGYCYGNNKRPQLLPKSRTSPTHNNGTTNNNNKRRLLLITGTLVFAAGICPYLFMWIQVVQGMSSSNNKTSRSTSYQLLSSDANFQLLIGGGGGGGGGGHNKLQQHQQKRYYKVIGSSTNRPLRTLPNIHDPSYYYGTTTTAATTPASSTATDNNNCDDEVVGGPQDSGDNDNVNNEISVTLALQATSDRAWILEEICKRWSKNNPIVAVVSRTQQQKSVLDLSSSPSEHLWPNWEEQCPQLTIIEYVLDEHQSQPDTRPINTLRNAALDKVLTSHVLMVDIDFIPSQNLDVTIQNALLQTTYQRKSSDPQEALVIPAFERLAHPACTRADKQGSMEACLNRCWNEEECGASKLLDIKNNAAAPSSFIPRNFTELSSCVQSKQCISFQADAKSSGHSTTRPHLWLQRDWYDDDDDDSDSDNNKGKDDNGASPSSKKNIPHKIKCFLSDQYEPYVVIQWNNKPRPHRPKCNNKLPAQSQSQQKEFFVPYYDERFHGYGKNKIQYSSHLRYMGYQFRVLPEGFLVHHPHPVSPSKLAWRDGNTQLLSSMNQLYSRFLRELSEQYLVGRENNNTIVPTCKIKPAKRVPTKQASSRVIKRPCAINFYGGSWSNIASSYEMLVLPSIVKNIIRPNAGYECDYFAHYYVDNDNNKEDEGQENNEKDEDEDSHPTEAVLLQGQIDLLSKKKKLSRVPSVAYVQESEEDIMKKYEELIQDQMVITSNNSEPIQHYTGIESNSTQLKQIMTEVKRWHSMEVSWKIMEQSSASSNSGGDYQYERVAMISSDVVYLTPIDIFRDGYGNVDNENEYAVIPTFSSEFPAAATDYMVYGPADTVKLWATNRFELLKISGDHHSPISSRSSSSLNYLLRPESFWEHALFPVMKEWGGASAIDQHKSWCSFFRSSKSVWVNNCDQQQDDAKRRALTDTMIDLTAPDLYESVDLNGDSSTATVIGMGTGYSLQVHQRFIGSLRKSGFKGNILILVESTVSPEIVSYFQYRNVTYREVEMINSTMCAGQSQKTTKKSLISDIHFEPCVKEYPSLKARWGRYPLLRDFLTECSTCTGPVLYIDMRDVFFQRDPFGNGVGPIKGLQLYQEHQNHTTTHWFVARPMLQCKGAKYNEPNLCSGSTVGTRAAMLKYLDIMFEEIKVWLRKRSCTFSDQSVHNYLFYSKQLPFATSKENQGGGIVNTVFHSARLILPEHINYIEEKYPFYLPPEKAVRTKKALEVPFEGANGAQWIDSKYNLVDSEGFFIEADGSRSRAIHKYDRFGGVGSHFYNAWLSKQDWLEDSVPSWWEATRIE